MKKVLLLGLAVIGFNAQAATLSCTGVVSDVTVYGSGVVRFKTEGANLSENVYICDLDSSWKGISPEACKSMLSQGQIAMTTGIQVTVRYVTSDYSACAELPINSLSIAPSSVIVSKT
jgi:hypothetical protein